MRDPKVIRIDNHHFRKILRISEGLLLIFFFLFSVEFFLYHLVFSKKVIPGVSLGGPENFLNLSGMTYGQSYRAISEKFVELEREQFLVKIGPVDKKINLSDLGFSFDATESARQAYRVGRTKNLLGDLKTEYKSLFTGSRVVPSYSLNKEKFGAFIFNIGLELLTREAEFYLSEGKVLIKPSKEGLRFSQDELSRRILASLSSLEMFTEVGAESTVPQVPTAKLESLRPDLLKFIDLRPTFFYGDKVWEVSKEEFLNLIDYRKSKVGNLSVNQEGVLSFLKKVAGEINVEPRAISFEAVDDKVVSFESGSDGLAVDEDKFKELIEERILSESRAKTAVPVNRIQPDVGSNSYGIRELIGEGISYFTGSIPGRRKNIKIASSKLNGYLLPPDKIFSFNNAVGEVTAANGYDYAYIISEGRTVLGTGGGVCQVSTTVFRAALNTGLPILKRTAHAYRVGYYEQGGFLPGLDATVFSPSVDLTFKNDTGNYILIQSVFDDLLSTLVFRFYGSKDGRWVRTEGPVITSSTGVPAPLYQDDSTLPKGTIRQVDFAAGGASVFFKRYVERDGGKTVEDTFYSHYSPWRAVYLVGTKE